MADSRAQQYWRGQGIMCHARHCDLRTTSGHMQRAGRLMRVRPEPLDL